MERTCVIVKPDGVCKNNAGAVIARLQQEGLKLVAIKMDKPSRGKIEQFYDVHKGKHFFPALIDFMASAPLIVTAWEGKGAVKKVRETIGATNSLEAAPGTLRRMYGTDGRRNLVHASDSPENGLRETRFFFSESEIFVYGDNDWNI